MLNHIIQIWCVYMLTHIVTGTAAIHSWHHVLYVYCVQQGSLLAFFSVLFCLLLGICYSGLSVPEGIINICSNDGDADHFSSPLSLSVCMTLPLVESARLQSCDTYLSKKHFVNPASIKCSALNYNLNDELMILAASISAWRDHVTCFKWVLLLRSLFLGLCKTKNVVNPV